MEASTPQQPQTQLSQEALNALYRDLGEKAHAIYERDVMIGRLMAENAEAKRLLAEVQKQYGPGEANTVDEEPTPMPARRKGG